MCISKLAVPGLMKCHLHSFLVWQVYCFPLPEIQRLPTSPNEVSTWCQFVSRSFIHAPTWEFVAKFCLDCSSSAVCLFPWTTWKTDTMQYSWRFPNKIRVRNKKWKISKDMIHVLYPLFFVPLPNYKNFCYSQESKENYSPKHIKHNKYVSQ